MSLPEPPTGSHSRSRVRVRARALRTASPEAEAKLWRSLRNPQLDNWKFRRQHPVGPYFADFACIEAKLIVELDGGQHFAQEAIEADRWRTAKLKLAGFEVLRFDNREALAETEGVPRAILQWLHANRPHPDPLQEHE